MDNAKTQQRYAKDEDTYAVDCMFVQDSTNYFTLIATLLTPQPVPVLNYEKDPLDLTDSTYTVHILMRRTVIYLRSILSHWIPLSQRVGKWIL